MLGSYVLSSGYYDAYFRKAAQTRRIIYDSYKKVLEQCDVICHTITLLLQHGNLGGHAEDPCRPILWMPLPCPSIWPDCPEYPSPWALESKMPVGIQLCRQGLCRGRIVLRRGPRNGTKAARVITATRRFQLLLIGFGRPDMVKEAAPDEISDLTLF